MPPPGVWKVEMQPVPDGQQMDAFLTILRCQQIWGWLTPAQRAALQNAGPDGDVTAHPRTLRSLAEHGFVAGGKLTEAARLVIAIIRRWAERKSA